MKLTKLSLLIIAILIIIVSFTALWLFHGVANQSQVIIETNTQDKDKNKS